MPSSDLAAVEAVMPKGLVFVRQKVVVELAALLALNYYGYTLLKKRKDLYSGR